MNKDEFIRALSDLGIKLNTKQLSQLDEYYRLLKEENKKYPRRTFSKEADKNLNQLLKKAEAERIELNKKGIRAEVFREEPFTMAQDDLDFHVYLLIWQNGWHKKRVTVEEIK